MDEEEEEEYYQLISGCVCLHPEKRCFFCVSPFPTPFPRMGRKQRKLQKLQKGYKQWLERTNRGDDESRPTVSNMPRPPVEPPGPSTSTGSPTPGTSPTSEDEDFIENVGFQSALDKRASLIREEMELLKKLQSFSSFSSPEKKHFFVLKHLNFLYL